MHDGDVVIAKENLKLFAETPKIARLYLNYLLPRENVGEKTPDLYFVKVLVAFVIKLEHGMKPALGERTDLVLGLFAMCALSSKIAGESKSLGVARNGKLGNKIFHNKITL